MVDNCKKIDYTFFCLIVQHFTRHKNTTTGKDENIMRTSTEIS